MTADAKIAADLAAKRVLDILAASLGLIWLMPLLIVLALAVALDSPGPVLFRQVRVGQRGKLFNLFKFRTMQIGGEKGPLITVQGDARTTRVGIFLRRSKLDELPQLFNVLRGEMSLVGPRPEVPSFVNLYSDRDRQIVLSARPGLTDFASLRFFDEGVVLAAQSDPERFYRERLMPQKLRLCRFYVRRRTLMLDLFILTETSCALIGRGRLRPDTRAPNG